MPKAQFPKLFLTRLTFLRSWLKHATALFGCTACDFIHRAEVLSDRDATATAEVKVIRAATAHIGSSFPQPKTNLSSFEVHSRFRYNLEGCDLYTTAHPYLMSLGAILWSRISRVYCGVTQQFAPWRVLKACRQLMRSLSVALRRALGGCRAVACGRKATYTSRLVSRHVKTSCSKGLAGKGCWWRLCDTSHSWSSVHRSLSV